MPEEDQTAPTGWTPEALMKVRDVSQVRVSPDGTRVVYCVTDPVMEEEKSEYVTQIYLANADGSDARQITFGEKSSGNPQWSPDGKWIAFAANRGGGKEKKENGKEPKSNLFLLRA